MEKDNKGKENIEDEEIDQVLKQNSGGYGYWKREGDLNELEFSKPKVVEKEIKEDSKAMLGSAWNTAGTWEEKHYKKQQIEEYFNSVIENKKFEGFSIIKFSSFSGDVS